MKARSLLLCWLVVSLLLVGVEMLLGDTETQAAQVTPTPPVAINEVAWAGTAASAADEWIELRNNTGSPIDLAGWTLVAADGTPNIVLAGTISANGYFLLERTDDNTVSDIPADQIYTGGLDNTGEVLTLRDESLNVIDTANADGGGWPGGTTGTGDPPYASMERTDPATPDTDANWGTNDGLTRNGLDANSNPINGTPKEANSVLILTPTPTATSTSTLTDTSTPTPTETSTPNPSTPTPTPTDTSTPTPTSSPPLAPLSVVINEVAWAGTAASANDEWIELRNNTGSPIDLTGWTLVAADGTPNIVLAGTISANGYFLLERTDDNTVSDIPADQIYTGGLDNTGEVLTLRDESLNVIDTANADGGGWPGGTTGTGNPPYASMERTDPAAPDTDANWHTNDGLTRNGLDANSNPINGTPRGANSVPTPTPTPTLTPTDTSTPTPTSSPPLAPLSVVINEVAWAGTAASANDEWIELRNNTGSPIDLAGWTLVAADGTPNIVLAGTISANGYFLLERTDDNTVSDIPADQIYTGGLDNTGEVLTLRDESLNVIDTANADGGGWPGGTTGTGSPPYASMERTDPAAPDTDANWHSNDSLTRNGLDANGNPINGTPRGANSILVPTPTPTSTTTSTPTPPLAPLSVVINEVAWAGTAASANDEWIELRNNTGSPIDLTGWTLAAADGTPNIALAGTIPANGYFLLERTDDNTVSDIPADQIYTGGLDNTGEVLTLRDESLNVIDTANADGGGWPGGTAVTGSPPYASMERTDPAAPDTDANWHSNDGLTRNGLDADGNPINGTPRGANSVPTPTPTSTPTPTPSPLPAPLNVVISEVVYDGTIPSTEGDEFVEICNPLTITVSLEGYKVGDEETQGDGEGMYRFPPGTVITPGACLVVARNAAQSQARFGFYPDFEMCTSGSGYTDTPGVPDMSQYTAWGTGSWALANGGDEVLLLGPSDEIVDAVAFSNGAYVTVGVTGTVSAAEPKSFQRVEDWDSDDMQADFVIDQPDPGHPLLVPAPPNPSPPAAPLPGGMQGYLGCLHSHSTFSDGSGPPRYAFAMARANNLHFLALTDHSNWFNDLQWTDTLAQAQAATVNGAFVGLRGFEWTSHEQGHCSVFATDAYVSREDPPYDTLAGFYAWLATQPEAIAQFNHPFGPPYDTDFDGFAYDAAAVQGMALLEVGNGSGEEYRAFEEAYLRALTIGWRVGAANNGDTETPDWGLDTSHRTGIVAPALTRGDLLAALRARRTFATEDSNLALTLRSGEAWMGSTIISPTAAIAFSVDFYDPDGEAIALELFDRSILVAATSVSGVISHTWTVTVPGAAGHFYFVRATQSDGDRAYTSPLWTEGAAAPEIITLYLNEVLPEPRYEDWNGDGRADSNDEWIELYNLGDTAVDLGGWQLDDVEGGGSSPYAIPFGAVIQPKGFLVFFKRETGIALNDDGDWVRLLYPDGSEADVFHYTYSPGDDRSWSRTIDGGGEWTKFYDVTPGEPNRPPRPEPTPTPFPLFTIAEARRQPAGTTVTVRGQVTVLPPFFGEKTLYIQDSTGGIMIYTSKNDYLPLAEGDWVVLRGEAYDYHGEREIRIFRDGDLLLHQGAGELLKPTVLKTGQVGEDHEGLLAMVAGQVVGYERYAIHLDDGTGPVRVYIKRETGIEKPWVEEGQIFSVIGIVSQYAQEKPYEGGYRLLPRYPSDLLQLPSYLPETGAPR